jgi:hypothetical protein
MTCVCGLPIVPGMTLRWTHAVNPGPHHHYARPSTRESRRSPGQASSSMPARASGTSLTGAALGQPQSVPVARRRKAVR